MNLKFHKYQGTGNDFIIIDNRNNNFKIDSDIISYLCNRRIGIGADGLICLGASEKYNFQMKYYNSDGKEGSMCGNGGRCITAFAAKLGIIGKKAVFEAIDGIHEAEIINFSDTEEIIRLYMKDVDKIIKNGENYFLNTGSPHLVIFTNNINEIDVTKEGRNIRYSNDFAPSGTNVNFVEVLQNELFVRTYERGVEDETLSCGTGVTATALAYASYKQDIDNVTIKTNGGYLNVGFKKSEKSFCNIYLQGAVKFVFTGDIDIQY